VDFSPSLFTLSRFRAASSGLRSQLSTVDLNPLPLLSASCSSPRSFTSTFQPHLPALASAPLLGFRPLQRSTESGVRISDGSNRRHRTSTGFLTLSTSCSARNHAGLVSSPLRSWGSTAPGTSNGPFSPTGVTCAGFLFTAFSSPVMDTFWRALPSCASPFSFVGTLSGHDASDDGRCTVLITEESVYPKVASQGHQPS